MVTAGQVVAFMDTRDLETSLRGADALATQAQRMVESVRADLEQQRSVVDLAQKELQRAQSLAPKGFETREVLDQRQSQLNVANALLNSTQGKLDAAIAAQESAQHNSALIKVNIADSILVAPKAGRIEYRLANVGEVLPAGGKVFTMLDTGYVYMDMFLPTAEAGLVQSAPMRASCWTRCPPRRSRPRSPSSPPRTSSRRRRSRPSRERDKLMFRMRVRIDPDLLRAHATEVRTGLPGMAYIRLDPKAAWPDALAVKPAPKPAPQAGTVERRRACRNNRRPEPRLRQEPGAAGHRPRHPRRLRGRADRPGRRRQVHAAWHHRRRQEDPVRHGARARRRHGRCRPPPRRLPAHRLHAAGARQEPVSRPQRAREHRLLQPPVRPVRRRVRAAAPRTCWPPPASPPSPTARPASCPAACARSSACAAR